MQAEMSILDEIDSGLDIDALRDVAKAVNALKTQESGVLMVTHYKVGWAASLLCTQLQQVACSKTRARLELVSGTGPTSMLPA
jgi:ABC-type transport system involved in cytochrome bd biosynthesis fused ATPase/permease subunit